MSFYSDLRRWGLAEWNLRTRPRPSAVEALLHPPHQSARKPGFGLPLPPKRGIGVPLVQTPVDNLAILEHGFFKIVTSGSPAPMYHTDDIGTYLGSAGTLNPYMARQEYLIGTVGLSNGRATWTTDATYWLSDPYTSQVWNAADWYTTAQNEVADIGGQRTWTGLAKLYTQIVMGCGRSFADTLASMHPIDSTTDGMLRMWDDVQLRYRRYWVRITAANGIQAAEFGYNLAGQAAQTWLDNNRDTLSITDKRFLDAWALEGATLGATVTTVMTPGDLAEYLRPGDPLAHGWAWSQLKYDTTTEDVAAASVVVHEPVGDGSLYRDASHLRVVFGLSGGALTATPEVVEDTERWNRIGNQQIWVPELNASVLELCRIQDTISGSTEYDAPLYVIWGHEGEIVVRQYSLWETTDDGGSTLLPHVELCDVGTEAHHVQRTYTQRLGGCYVVGGPMDKVREWETIVSGDIDFTVEATTQYVCGDPLWHDEFTPGPGCRPHPYKLCTYPPGYTTSPPFGFVDNPNDYRTLPELPGEYTIQLVKASELRDYISDSTLETATGMILTSNPEIFYIFDWYNIQRHNWGVEWTDRETGSFGNNLAISGEWEMYHPYYDETYTGSWTSRFGSTLGGLTTSSSPGGFRCYTGDPGRAYAAGLGSLIDDPDDDWDDYTTIRNEDVWMYTPEGHTWAGGTGSWPGFHDLTPPDLLFPCVGHTAGGMLSYWEAAGYYYNTKNTTLAVGGQPYDGSGIVAAGAC